MVFEKGDEDFNHSRGKQVAIKVVRKRYQETIEKAEVRSELDTFSATSETIRKAVGTAKSVDGTFYRITIEVFGNQFTLTLGLLRGRPICAKQLLPDDFVFFEHNQDEELPILLQSVKERIEALVRAQNGEIPTTNGQIADSFFDTSKIPDRVGISL